jgi:CRISPR-associated protein Cas2
MSSDKVIVVYAYDISETRTRDRVADLLEQRAVRVQKSVFEARLARKRAELLFNRLAAMLDEGDSLRMYVLSKSGLSQSRVYGGAPLPEEGTHWLL